MTDLWNDLLTATDKAVIKQAGYAGEGAASWDSRSVGVRPALLIIDMQRMLVGRNVPILEAVKEYRPAMGEIAWRALPYIEQLLAACRTAGLPIFHTRVIPGHMTRDDAALNIVETLTPATGEMLLDKSHASAFFGTDLVTRLVQQRIDSVIVAGNSTSGCVRATAVVTGPSRLSSNTLTMLHTTRT